MITYIYSCQLSGTGIFVDRLDRNHRTSAETISSPSYYCGWRVTARSASVLFFSRPHPRVGHTVDALSPFISVLCHSDWLFHGDSCPRIDVFHPGRAWSFSPACTMHMTLFLALSLSPGNFLVSLWCNNSMLASLLWQCLTVPFLLQLC